MPRKYESEDERIICKAWENMKSRCYNPNHNSFKNYGAKGIKVCDEWLHDFKKFYRWSMANGYQYGLTIDRIESTKDYSPSNCRWVSRTVQNNNTNRNFYITYMGEEMTTGELATKVDIPYHIIKNRVTRGWTAEKAVSTPYTRRINNATI